MNKTNLIVRLALPVLSAGLVSCAKDDTKITRDTFKAPSPVINNKGSQDLKTWDRRSDKSLDLQDSFDVSAGGPAKLEVTARCRRDQQSYNEKFSFVPRAPIKIFQVLPPDLLTHDISTEKIDCAFELVLSNEVGSKHIYQISNAPVTDETGAGVALEKNGTDEKVERIHTQKLEGLRIRFRNAGPAAAQVFCQDMTLPDMPFEQVLELIHFNFAKPEIKPRLYADILIEHPRQPCRILIRQAGQIVQISSRFTAQLPQPPMTAAVLPIAPNSQQKQRLFVGVPLNAALIQIRNSNPVGLRYLKVGKTGQESVIEAHHPTREGYRIVPARTDQYVRPWSFAIPQAAPGIEVVDKGDHYLVKVSAGQTSSMILQIRPPGAQICPSGVMLSTEHIALAAKIEITEVSERGEKIEDIQVVLPRIKYMNILGEPTPPTAGPCAW